MRSNIISIMLIAGVLLGGAGVERYEKKGLVTYVDGRVKKKNINSEDWENAPENTEIFSGDKVRTYQRSRAELELVRLEIVRMAPETIIDIMKLYEETKEEVRELEIRIERGELWANVAKVSASTRFKLSTPVAVAAVTGTTLRMRVEPDSTTELRVYKGEVRITNAPEREDLKPRLIKPRRIKGPHRVPGPRQVTLEEWVYIVREMQRIKIDPGGRVIWTGAFSLEDPEEKTEWVLWNLRRDKLLKR